MKNSLLTNESVDALKELIDVVGPKGKDDVMSNHNNFDPIYEKYLNLMENTDFFTAEEIEAFKKRFPNIRSINQINAEELAKHAKDLKKGKKLVDEIAVEAARKERMNDER